LKKLFSSLFSENRRGIACFVFALLCLQSTAEAQFVSARKNTEKPNPPAAEQLPENKEMVKTPEAKTDVAAPQPETLTTVTDSNALPKAKRRETMGAVIKTDSKSFFKQRNISNKLYFPIRSPYIPRVGGTDIRQEAITIDFDRNNLIRETSASEELEAPTVISENPQDILNSTPADSAAMSAGTSNDPKDKNVTYQFQDRELVIDERHLQNIDPGKIPQNKFVIKHLRNDPQVKADEPKEEAPRKTILSNEYKGNMELVDPNEVLMFFEKEQEDDDKITVGTQFVVPYENGPAPVNSQGSSANYEVTE
jgi:hypothetical protein